MKFPQNHYSTGYLECLEQINNATNTCYMDSNIKSRLLYHLIRKQNVRIPSHTKRPQGENCVSLAATLSVPRGHSATLETPTYRVTLGSSRASSVNSQLYINTDSSTQDSYSGETRPIGQSQKASTSHLPPNVPPHGPNVRAVQAVDDNNNIVNPAVPGHVSGAVWRPW